MLAKDIMTREVVTTTPVMTVKELARLLIQNQISGAPVVDRHGEILGIVSEGDIVAKSGRQVKEIMSKKVLSVTEESPVEEMASLMSTHKVKRLPVMQGKKLVGIVSRADIVGAIARGRHIALHTPIYDL
ncbi:MAG: CBS domain-containing protein [Candidatus Binatia bacterium]